jgi:hypothetical protein
LGGSGSVDVLGLTLEIELEGLDFGGHEAAFILSQGKTLVRQDFEVLSLVPVWLINRLIHRGVKRG